jgi:DNA-binding NarL/FixJ family response regulator
MLIEPHAVLRQSLHRWLEADLPPCALLEANDLARALTLVSVVTPHAILLDLDALSEDNLGDIRRLAQLCPQAEVIGIGIDETPSHRQRAEAAGVTIFVTKAQLQSDLPRVLQEINSAAIRNTKKAETKEESQ